MESDIDREAWAGIVGERSESNPDEKALLRQLYLAQLTDPRMRGYLVRVNGEAACRCQLFSANGLGRVEAVRTREKFQRRGLAAAVIRMATADSVGLGNYSTYMYAEPGQGPQKLYHRLGYRTVTQRATRGFVLP